MYKFKIRLHSATASSYLESFFLKALKCVKKTQEAQETHNTVFSTAVCVCVCSVLMAAVGMCYMWSESVCVTMVRGTNGHGCLRPRCFSHPPAAGEKQLLLTRRSRLQILSMLRILSLCGADTKTAWLKAHLDFRPFFFSSSKQFFLDILLWKIAAVKVWHITRCW